MPINLFVCVLVSTHVRTAIATHVILEHLAHLHTYNVDYSCNAKHLPYKYLCKTCANTQIPIATHVSNTCTNTRVQYILQRTYTNDVTTVYQRVTTATGGTSPGYLSPTMTWRVFYLHEIALPALLQLSHCFVRRHKHKM